MYLINKYYNIKMLNNIIIIIISLMLRKVISTKLVPKFELKHSLHIKLQKFLDEKEYPIVITHGPAGTGKTTIVCNHSIKCLKNDIYKKIVITRPIISTDEAIGFLPGDLNEKMNPWLLPIFDVFMEYYTKTNINDMIKNGIIEIAPFSFMRGRTFKDCIVIADEMQNSTPSQMKMLLTRLGSNSKIAITGDLDQQDINTETNGLKDLLNLLDNRYQNKYELYNDGYGLVEFTKDIVVRQEMVKKVLDLYDLK
jgi:phosphate starvation-inducible PhoH-like protein